MATDATGTPTTNFSLPKFNTSVDPPSGLGTNAMMDAVDVALGTRMGSPSSPGTGDVPVWNGSTWVKSSGAQKVNASAIAPGSNGQVLTTTGGVAAWGTGSNPVFATFVPVTVGGAGYTANTLTSVLLQAIAGGTIGTTKKLRAQVNFTTMNNTAGGTTARFQILWGGSPIWDATWAGIDSSGSAVRRPGHIFFEIVPRTDTGHQIVTGWAQFQTSTSTPATGIGNFGANLQQAEIGTGVLAVDSTVSQNLEIKVSRSVGSTANLDMIMEDAMIEVVG